VAVDLVRLESRGLVVGTGGWWQATGEPPGPLTDGGGSVP
jgi:hypothetical protein